MSYELKRKLKALSNHTNAGVVDAAWMKKNKELLMMQVKNTVRVTPEVSPESFSAWKRALIFAERFFVTSRRPLVLVARPLVIISLVVALPFSGWISTVNAARLSVSGDELYNVKIISEKVQISLTSNKRTKIALRTEFAARRADEVVKLKANAPEKPESEVHTRIKKTIEKLEEEIKTVDEELDGLSESESPDEVLEAARLVDVKSEEIARVLDKSADIDEIPEIRKAKDLVDEVAVNAVETIIKTKEEGATVTDDEIKQSIEGKLQNKEKKIDRVLDDLDYVVASTTVRSTVTEIDENKELQQKAQKQAKTAKEVVVKALESVERSDFGEALEKVKEVDTAVNEAEELLAHLEEDLIEDEDGSDVEEIIAGVDGENSTTTTRQLEFTTPRVSSPENEGIVEIDIHSSTTLEILDTAVERDKVELLE